MELSLGTYLNYKVGGSRVRPLVVPVRDPPVSAGKSLFGLDLHRHVVRRVEGVDLVLEVVKLPLQLLGLREDVRLGERHVEQLDLAGVIGGFRDHFADVDRAAEAMLPRSTIIEASLSLTGALARTMADFISR